MRLAQASVTLPALVVMGEAVSDDGSSAAVAISMDMLPLDLCVSSHHVHLVTRFTASLANVILDAAKKRPESDPGAGGL